MSAPDFETADRGLYELAYMLVEASGGRHQWGEPIRFKRDAPDGTDVFTTFKLPDGLT